jgi:hypothetical protein
VVGTAMLIGVRPLEGVVLVTFVAPHRLGRRSVGAA